MWCELINTGSELMLGRVLNTHQSWLCRQLSDLGHEVARQVAVPDTAAAIETVVREALGRADLVVTTGGLGPTSDDLTREAIAGLVGRRLVEDAATLERLEAFFAARRRPMPPSTRVQAMVPEGAIVLANELGTAPGLVIEVQPNPFREGGRASWLILLPGPPRELRPMFTRQVVPFLEARAPAAEEYACRTLRSTGLGESVVEERIAPALAGLVAGGLEIGYCARPGEVDVRLVARGAGATERVLQAQAVVEERLGATLYAQESEGLESVIVRTLTERGETLAVAESCTGGLVAHRVTNVPGASAVLRAGWVVYSDEAKQRCLGVRPETLLRHGAVSEATVREMAEGARREAGSTYAVAVTGIAGPGGGTEDKPVGTAHLAVAGPGGTQAVSMCNPMDRETFKQVTSQQALDLMRRALRAG